MNAELESLARELLEDYFVRRDYPKLMGRLAGNFSFIGTGIREYGHLKDMGRYFAAEKELYSGNFTLSDLNLCVEQITDDVALVQAGLTVESDPATGYLVQLRTRATILLHKEAPGWKVVHVHNSVPYQEQGEETYFNHAAAIKNDHTVERLAESIAQEQIAQAKQHDSLTGIYNLEGFAAQAREIIDTNPERQFALLKFSINHFRYINQNHGYEMGDAILRDIAVHLEAACGPQELCGRTERNNFAMLMTFHGTADTTRRIKSLEKSLLGEEIKRKVPTVKYTGGIYPVPSVGSENVKRMLDKALLAKQSVSKLPGQSQYAFYSPAMDELLYSRVKLAEQAPAAMEQGEFKLFIQPQVDLKTLCPVSGEALARWVQPDGTVIMPGDFIPLFEDNDFILSFDFYMLETLCRKMRAWMDKGLTPIPVSINQSRQHLRYEDYIDRFCAVVDRYEIPHRYIGFELTESAFVECGDLVLTMARELHRRGFLLDIDDFGTGYASLNLLSQVTADVLKLDRSLLEGFEYSSRSKTILRKVIEMAQETEMVTICEGVETQVQLDYLRMLGCDMAQGFLFYKSMPAEQFELEVLKAQQAIPAAT